MSVATTLSSYNNTVCACQMHDHTHQSGWEQQTLGPTQTVLSGPCQKGEMYSGQGQNLAPAQVPKSGSWCQKTWTCPRQPHPPHPWPWRNTDHSLTDPARITTTSLQGVPLLPSQLESHLFLDYLKPARSQAQPEHSVEHLIIKSAIQSNQPNTTLLLQGPGR